MTHDVFISYSTKDKQIADAVCAKLEEQKIRCWIAPRDISAGENFARAIINAINNCKVFVLLWSSNTNTSEHILNEINQAFDQGITIIPFRIQDVQPTAEMRYYFGRTHWLDALTPPLEKHIDKLAKAILPLISQQPVSPDPEQPLENEPHQTESAGLVINGQSERHHPSEKRINKGQKPSKRKILALTMIPVVVIASLIILYITGIFDGFPLGAVGEETSTPTASQTPTKPHPTPIPTLTPTSTPTPPAWVSEYTEKILAAIADHEPDFQDDFSEDSANWEFMTSGENCLISSSTISDGTLNLIAEPNCQASILLRDSENISDFVVTIEIAYERFKIIDLIGFRTGDYTWYLGRNGEWEYIHFPPNSGHYTVGEGKIPVDNDQILTITLVGYHDRKIVLVDDIPVIFLIQDSPAIDDSFQLSTIGGDLSQQIVQFDNARFWNLNAIPSLNEQLP